MRAISNLEEWEERAAIIEFMGGESRETAERMATELLGEPNAQ